MVVGTADLGTLADVIFAIEGTAINGAYLNDMKTNYIIPTLEYFNQGNIEEKDYVSEGAGPLYGVVIYHAADRLPSPTTDVYGPYSNPHKVLVLLEKLDLNCQLHGGHGESNANVAEALATSLICLDDLQARRENGLVPQKHCILISNSPPYLMPVMENQAFSGNSAEQLASLFSEKNVNLSILSPRKIPAMFRLFEKAGGDLTSSQTKNYAKDPRHLVLLKGFSLKERSISPTAVQTTHSINVATLSSPLQSHGSPMAAVPPTSAPQPNSVAQPMMQGGGPQVQGGPPTAPVAGRGFPPPAYHGSVRPRWPMMPPGHAQRPTGYAPAGSALLEQLARPPSAITSQFNSSPGMAAPVGGLNPQQAQQQQQQQVSTQQQLRVLGNNVMGQQQLGQQQLGQQQLNQQQQLAQQQMTQQQLTQQQMAQQQMGQQQMGQQQLGQQQLGQQQLGQQQVAQSQPGLPQTQQGMLPQQGNVLQQPVMMGQNPSMGQNTVMMQQGSPALQQQPTQQPSRQPLWSGILEWFEKTSNDAQKVTHHVPCQVTSNQKDGEPELKADSWPSKLLMQLMPKQLVGTIGGAYLKNSKSVYFYPQPGESREALVKVMSNGFAGCVHFNSLTPSPYDIKVLILVYTPDKRSFLGFIPNDQVAFVDRLRKVIHQQKTCRQSQAGGGQGGQGVAAMGAPQGPPQQPTMANMLQQTGLPQQQQTMGFQNVAGGGNPVGGQPGPTILGVMQSEANQQQPPTSQAGPNFNNQLAEARQENLVKIQRLRQTLEAAQQQELQYKNQLEVKNQETFLSSRIINHMKMQQMQDNGSLQQQQDQYKTQLEDLVVSQQEQQKQLRAQLQQMQQQQTPQQQQQVRALAPQQQPQQQQRMMRPNLPNNNPGLRHLLQQPQYRLNMQQQLPRAGIQAPGPQPQNPNQQQQFDDSYDFLS